MAELRFDINGSSQGFKKALDDATNGIKKARKNIEDEGQSLASVFTSLKKASMGLGVALGLNELKNLGFKIAKTRSDFQQLETSFKTMLGSGEKADAMLKQLIKTASTTPFGLQELAGGAKSLLAYGIEASKVNDTLVRLGDIASGLSIPLNDLIYLYGTTMTQGRMFTQDLRQFQGRGIPIADELAKQFGIAKSEVAKFVTAGKVGAKEVEQAIISMTSAGGKFGGLMNAQSQTIGGRWSNIEDQIDMAFNEMGKGAEDVINSILDSIAWLVENYKTIGISIGGVIASYGVWKATLVGHNALLKAQAINEEERIKLVANAYDKEIAKLRELHAVQQESAVAKNVDVDTSDIKQAVDSGAISKERADELIHLREITAEKKLLAEAELVNASALVKEKKANLENAEALADTALAQEDLLQKKLKGLDEQIALSEQLGDTDEYVSLMTEREAVAEELSVASKKANNAVTEAGIASRELDTAVTRQQTAVRNLNSASAQANTAATLQNTSAQVLNTNATRSGTLADKAAAIAKGALTATINGARKAWNALKLAFMSNPIGLIATAITAVISGVMAWSSKQKELNKSLEEGKDSAKGYFDTLKQEGSTIESYVKTIRDKNAKDLDQIKAYRELIKLVPEITNQYTQQELAALNAAKAEELLTEAIKKREIAKSEKDIATAQSTLKSLESGGKWDELRAEERKFLKETMAFDRSADPDKMKKALEGFIPTAKNAHKNLVQLNKISELQGMDEGATKVEAITSELDKLKAKKRLLEDFTYTLTKYGENVGTLEGSKLKKALNEFNPQIKESFGFDIKNIGERNLFGFLDKDMTQSSIKSFLDLYFDGVADNINANIKMLEDETKTAYITPKLNLSKKEIEKEITRIEGELNDNLRILEQNRELENIIALNTNVEDENARKTVEEARNKLNANAKILGQDAYVSTTLNWAINVAPTYGLTSTDLSLDNIPNSALLEGDTNEALKAKNKILEGQIAALKKEIEAKINNEPVVNEDELKKAYNVKKASAEQAKITKENAEEQKKILTEANAELTKVQVDLTHDSAKKVAAQEDIEEKERNREQDKRLEEAKKQEIARQKKAFEAKENLRKAQAEKNGTTYQMGLWSDDMFKETSEYKKIIETIKQLNDAETALAKIRKNNEKLDSYNAYLQEYGSLKAKELAITEEYAKKIAEAEAKKDKGQVAKLTAERDTKIQGLQSEDLASQINNMLAFGDGNAFLKGMMKNTYVSMKKYLDENEFASLPPESQQSFIEAMTKARESLGIFDISIKDVAESLKAYNEAEKALRNAKDKESTALGDVKYYQKEYNTNQNEENLNKLLDAQEELKNATNKVVSAENNLIKAQNGLINTSQEMSNSFTGIGRFFSNAGLDQIGGLFTAFSDLQKILDMQKIASADGAGEITKLATGASEAGGVLGKISEVFSGNDLISQIIGGILKIFDILKDGIGPLIAGIIESILGAVANIIENILSGDFLIQIGKALIEGIRSILKAVFDNLLNIFTLGAFDSVGGLFQSGNAEEVKEAIAKLTKRNELLTEAIDHLREEMEKTRGTKSVEAYKEAVEYQTEKEENLLNIAKNQAAYSGSHHSWNYYWAGFTDEEIAKFSKKWGKVWDGTLWGLSPSEMADLINDPAIAQRIQATGKGYYGGAVYEDLKAYADEAEVLQELTNTLYEGLTTISFESMYDSFVSALMDMEYSAEDAADNIAEYFMKAMVSNKVGELMYDRLEDWWQDFGEAMRDTDLTAEERYNLATEYQNLINEGILLRDQIADAIGYTGESSKTSASQRGVEGMTQTEAEELNGRFTALQIAGEAVRSEVTSMNNLIRLFAQQIAPAITSTQGMDTTLKELRELAWQRNNFLSDISEYTKTLLAMKTILSNIETNTK